uniref:Uncharacterized protein n=1 Tax=Anguilla anguilla TaxID=7936 RepID=A0A0E9QWC0_ANGAN
MIACLLASTCLLSISLLVLHLYYIEFQRMPGLS